MACERCGREHVTPLGNPACTGHRSKNHATDPGGPCAANPMRGQTKCTAHGGRSPQAKAKAKERVQQAKAEKILRRFGEPIDTTPTEALLDSVKWTAGYVAWLRDKVAGVDTDEALVWGTTKETDDAVVVGNGPGAYVEHVTKQTREAKTNAWLTLLGEWSDRLVRICAEAIKAGIAERQVKLAEAQGELVVGVIRKILADLNLSAEQESLIPQVVPRHLRAVAG